MSTNLQRLLDVEFKCSKEDPELWFSDFPEEQDKAIRICMGCPAQAGCLQYALENKVYGIWGATRETTRREMRKKLGIKGISLSYMNFK